MNKIIEINLKGIKCQSEIVARVYNSLKLNVAIDGEETIQSRWYKRYLEAGIPNEIKIKWEAFYDNLLKIDYLPGYEDIENMELHLVIKGWKDVEKVLSEREVEIFKETLDDLSKLHPYKEDTEYLEKLDGNFRYDALKKFSYEIQD